MERKLNLFIRENDMTERLTNREVSKSFTEQELKTSEQARIYQKLGKLEDILEKYDLEVEELDERIRKGAFNYIDKLRAEIELDTWKKACELASETLKQVMGKPLWIGGNIPTPEVKDSEYFYQQAKKENN